MDTGEFGNKLIAGLGDFPHLFIMGILGVF